MSSTQTHLELNKSECLKDTIPKGKVSKSIGLIFIFLRVQHIIVTLHTVHEGCVLQLMKTCIYIYTYKCICLCIYICKQRHTHIYICIRTYVRTFIHACIHSLIHSLIHSFIHYNTYIHIFKISISHPHFSSAKFVISCLHFWHQAQGHGAQQALNGWWLRFDINPQALRGSHVE